MRWTRGVVAVVCLGVVALRAPAARAADTGVYAELFELVLEGDDTAPPLQATLTVYQDGTAHAVAVHAGTRAVPGALVFTIDAAGVVGVGRVEGAAGAPSFQLGGTASFPLFAAVTTVQRDAVTPAAGMVVYNTDTARLESYENGAWHALATVAALDDIGDVTIAAPADDDVLAYDAATGAWTNQAAAAAGLAPAAHTHAGEDIASGTVADARVAATLQRDAEDRPDAAFRIADDADPTKRVAFEAAAVAAGTTRTIAAADQDVNLAPGSTYAAASHTHAAGDVTSGALAVARGGTGADNSGATGFQHYAAGTGVVLKSNLGASGAPSATDDGSAGYAVGSVWIDTAGDTVWQASDVTVGAAVWNRLDGAGGALTVREQDGTPSVANVTTVTFDNGTVTDDGGGAVSVSNGGGAETDPTLTNDNAVAIGDGASGGNLDLTFDGDAGTDGVLRYDTTTDSFKPQNEMEFPAGIPLSVDYTEPPDNGVGDFEDFADNSSGVPTGWTEDDAAFNRRTDTPFDFFRITGSSGDGTWKYSQQRTKNVESQSANVWTSYIIGPVRWNDNQLNDTVDYYFGQHANSAGTPSTTVYARVHLQWDSAGAQWRVRGEIKDGTTETQGSWHTFVFPYAQPVWFRVTTQNSINKDTSVYMSINPPKFDFAWFLLHSDTPGQTWGQVWTVLRMSRGTTDSHLNSAWIGQVQDAGNAS